MFLRIIFSTDYYYFFFVYKKIAVVIVEGVDLCKWVFFQSQTVFLMCAEFKKLALFYAHLWGIFF
jgi:hypothetical protein